MLTVHFPHILRCFLFCFLWVILNRLNLQDNLSKSQTVSVQILPKLLNMSTCSLQCLYFNVTVSDRHRWIFTNLWSHYFSAQNIMNSLKQTNPKKKRQNKHCTCFLWFNGLHGWAWFRYLLLVGFKIPEKHCSPKITLTETLWQDNLNLSGIEPHTQWFVTLGLLCHQPISFICMTGNRKTQTASPHPAGRGALSPTRTCWEFLNICANTSLSYAYFFYAI